jgi:hypothetical protein
MDVWHTMDNIVSNITVVRNVVRSNIYEGIRTVFIGSVPSVVKFTGNGLETYYSALLIGKTVLFLFTDNLKRDPEDYTVDSAAGTVVFNEPRDIGEKIELLII